MLEIRTSTIADAIAKVENPEFSYGINFSGLVNKTGVTMLVPSKTYKNPDREIAVHISDELLDRLIRYRNLARDGIDSDRPMIYEAELEA